MSVFRKLIRAALVAGGLAVALPALAQGDCPKLGGIIAQTGAQGASFTLEFTTMTLRPCSRSTICGVRLGPLAQTKAG